MTSEENEDLYEDFTPDTTMGLVNNFKDMDCVEYDEFLELHEDINKKVKLNFEHDKYVWCDYTECKKLDIIPNLDIIIENLKNKGYFG